MTLTWPLIVSLMHIGLIVWLVLVILLRRTGSSDTRLAWIVFIVLAPFIGAIAYMFLGGPRIAGRRRRKHARIHHMCIQVQRECATPSHASTSTIPAPYDRVFSLAGAVTDTDVTGGNSLQLSRTPQDFANEFEQDLDQACDTIHVLTYIYLDDEMGHRVGNALIRAAQRQVKVRLLVDSVGSRNFLRSPLRAEIAKAGVQIVELLPATLVRMIFSRLDLRNHRKIAVIDNHIGWVGSRNMASPSFAPKARYAPWVDCMARMRGPAVQDLQILFLEDLQGATGEHLPSLIQMPQTAVE